MVETIRYSIEEVKPFINWLYFFHAWQLPTKYGSLAYVHNCSSCKAQWLGQFDDDEKPQALEAQKLYDDACLQLQDFEKCHSTWARIALLEAQSDNDDIIVYKDSGESVRLPMLRQQHETAQEKPNLSLADFIVPKQLGRKDRIGVFATTIEREMENPCTEDPYRKMLAQTLCDRLAEATAEKLHADVRKRIWGYAPDEKLSPQEMFQCRYTGIRPAVGYPSLPDQSINFLLNQLAGFEKIGIRLTESGAMQPHGSVSGLMLSHPKASYFAIGKIDNEQLADYACRRGIDIEKARKFLTANL